LTFSGLFTRSSAEFLGTARAAPVTAKVTPTARGSSAARPAPIEEVGLDRAAAGGNAREHWPNQANRLSTTFLTHESSMADTRELVHIGFGFARTPQ
jgi:hypothetical protein